MRIATFDLETDGFLEDCTQVWCAAVKDHDTGDVEGFGPDDIDRLIRVLDSYDVLIGHNAIGFDFPVLRKLYGWEFKGTKVDTLLMSRMQRPDRSLPPHCTDRRVGPHSVEAWGYRLGRRKVEHEDWTQFTPEMLHRCMEDAEIQFLIYHALLEEGRGEGWANAHKLNHKLFHYLQIQEECGWLVDRAHLDRCLVFLNGWIARIDAAVGPHLPLVLEIDETKKEGAYGWVKKPFKKDGSYAEVTRRFLDASGLPVGLIGGPFSRVSFRRVDLDKPLEVKDFLLAQGWEPNEWNTDSEGNRTSPKLGKDDEFRGIRSALGRLIARRIQCKQRRGTVEGWAAAIRPDGRIPAQVAGVASTGRLRHKLIVNVPGKDAFFGDWMRKIFIARPGWVMVGVDSKGNQMRQLAARMGDDDFTHAVLHGNSKDGTDLHSLNQKRSGVSTRTKAKNFFYGGILFGAGNKKGGKLIGDTPEAFAALKEQYFREMPKLRELLDREIEAWRATARKLWNPRFHRWEFTNGYIKGLDGRPVQVEFEKDILVYYLQSDEAIQMAAAYCWFYKQMERRWVLGQDYCPLIWMHDEIQLECRPEIAEEVADLACEAISWAGRFFNIACPHEGEAKIGKNWAETH